jgi:hypothetical protein
LQGSYVENLRLTGSTAVTATGNLLANRLTGNAADNVLNGLAGADTMAGGGGDDRYHVDSAGDLVVEAGGRGIDLVFSSVSYSLREQFAERLTLTGAAAINGTGNPLDNRIVGNGAANVLGGGLGKDELTGSSGADAFVFNAPLTAANADVVADFASGVDKIRLENAIFKGLAAGALGMGVFHVGATAHDLDDRVIYDRASGRLLFDDDGTGARAAKLVATLPGGAQPRLHGHRRHLTGPIGPSGRRDTMAWSACSPLPRVPASFGHARPNSLCRMAHAPDGTLPCVVSVVMLHVESAGWVTRRRRETTRCPKRFRTTSATPRRPAQATARRRCSTRRPASRAVRSGLRTRRPLTARSRRPLRRFPPGATRRR